MRAWRRSQRSPALNRCPEESLAAVNRKIIDWCSDYIAGILVDTDDGIKHVRNWSRQTLAFAASIRAEELGKPVNAQERALAAGNEIQQVGIELWEAAGRECKQPPQRPEHVMRFARRVLAWAIDHLKDVKV